MILWYFLPPKKHCTFRSIQAQNYPLCIREYLCKSQHFSAILNFTSRYISSYLKTYFCAYEICDLPKMTTTTATAKTKQYLHQKSTLLIQIGMSSIHHQPALVMQFTNHRKTIFLQTCHSYKYLPQKYLSTTQSERVCSQKKIRQTYKKCLKLKKK